MAANLKRLICKRIGGLPNFISFVLLMLVMYLLVQNYNFKPYSKKVIDESSSHLAGSSESEAKSVDKYEPANHTSSDNDHAIDKQNQANQISITTKQIKLTRRRPVTTHPDCVIDEKCSGDSIPYKIISGEGMDKYPSICFNGELLIDKSLTNNIIGRGINMILINNETLEIKAIENFDTFVEDAHFHRRLKLDTNDGDIILMASYDEMANGLRDVSHKFMENFGSQVFKNIKYRDSYAALVQRGIPKGKAIELIESKGKKDFGKAAKLTGCVTLPLGQIKPVKIAEMHVNTQDQIVVGSVVKNCGMREPCKENEFAVHVYTGKNNEDEPKICVDGRYVISSGINDAGRGLNVVIVGNGKEILKTAHFDTYEEDSTNLEIFLENMSEDVIIIIVTFDEASNKLSSLARNLLYEIGSGVIQNLRHRDSWYIIGRKNIKGFSPLEEISYAGTDGYPPPLDRKLCVPQTIKGMKIRPDPLPIMNDKRRNFCSRYDGYGDFCLNENIDKALKPAPIINKTLEDHPIYNTPILIIAGMSHSSLRMTLETVIMQPGIRPDLVYVYIDEKLDELFMLVELFGFQTVKIKSSYDYNAIYHRSLQSWFDNPIENNKKFVIVIEEELILSPDFLYFFTQVFDAFVNDPKLVAVSAWNSNSYLQLDGSASRVYRTNEFPGLGYLLKRSAYQTYMHDQLEKCCNQRAWNNWTLRTVKDSMSILADVDVLVPDVSRVFHRPYDSTSKEQQYLQKLFNRKRKTNLIPFPVLDETSQYETREAYDKHLKKLLSESLELPNVNECYTDGSIQMPNTSKKIYKIVYSQESADDTSKLRVLTKCFHLFNHETSSPKCLYSKNILRFNAHQNDYILIGSMHRFVLND